MADMATIAMKGQHWIIIDLIAASPAGKVSQAKIQEAFGKGDDGIPRRTL